MKNMIAFWNFIKKFLYFVQIRKEKVLKNN